MIHTHNGAGISHRAPRVRRAYRPAVLRADFLAAVAATAAVVSHMFGVI
jgi:hypothetical protein